MTRSICTFSRSIASACGIVRGKPSNRKPLAQSACVIRSFTRAIIRSSDTNPPDAIMSLTFRPRAVPAATAARNMSPVEICGIPIFSIISFACVPFPAPGAPNKITLIFLVLLSCRIIQVILFDTLHSWTHLLKHVPHAMQNRITAGIILLPLYVPSLASYRRKTIQWRVSIFVWRTPKALPVQPMSCLTIAPAAA